MQQDEALRQLQAAADFGAIRGSLLFHLDLATELGRAALRERGLTDEQTVTIVDGDGYGIIALDDKLANEQVAVVRFAADGRPIMAPSSGAPPRRLVAMMWAKRILAREFPAPAYSIVVVPPSDEAPHDTPIEAYALRRADRPSDVMIGRHWLATLSLDGDRIIDRIPLSRTDMVLASRPELPPMDLELTHFGAVPTEIHSYLCLKHGMAMQVATLESSLLWRVGGERVELLGPSPS